MKKANATFMIYVESSPSLTHNSTIDTVKTQRLNAVHLTFVTYDVKSTPKQDPFVQENTSAT